MMILIKVSDISNEARPMEVAEPWLDCLLQEFYNQVMSTTGYKERYPKNSHNFTPGRVYGVLLLGTWMRTGSLPEASMRFEFVLDSGLFLIRFPAAVLLRATRRSWRGFRSRPSWTKPWSQTGFIRFVLLPLFIKLVNLFSCLEVGPNSSFKKL